MWWGREKCLGWDRRMCWGRVKLFGLGSEDALATREERVTC